MHASGKASSFRSQTLRALAWNYAGVASKAAAQLAVTAVLARLLGPSSFGEVAAALLCIGFVSLIGDSGFGAALVQKNGVTHDDVAAAFTWQLIAATALAGATLTAAPAVEILFASDGLAAIVRALTPLILLQPVISISNAQLRRRLAFRQIQTCTLLSYLGGYALVGVTAALAGAGTWALVYAQIAQSVVAAAAFYWTARPPIGLRLGGDRNLYSFGLKALATNIMNWTVETADNAIVGRTAGVTSLGLYSVSYNLVRNPTNQLVSTLQAVLFPAASRAQDDRALLRKGFMLSVNVVSLLMFPIFFACAATASTVIDGLYGAKWSGAETLLLPLALAMPFHAVGAVAGSMLWATGNIGREMRLQFLFAVALVGSALVFHLDAVQIAWLVLGLYAVRAVLLTLALARTAVVEKRHIAIALRGALFLSAIVAPCLALADWTIRLTSAPSGVRLIALMICGAVVFPVAVFAAPRVFFIDDAVTLLARLAGKLPQRAAGFVRVRLGEGAG